MAEPAQAVSQPPLFPGAAELFAISYRTQWQALGITPPDRLQSVELNLKPPQPIERAVAGIESLMAKLRTADDLPADFRRLKEPRLYPFNLARFAIAQLARGEMLHALPTTVLRPLQARLAQALENDPDFRRLQDQYTGTYKIDNQREPEEGDRVPRFESARFFELIDGVARDPDIRFFRAFSAPELRLLNGQNSAPRRIRNYTINRSYTNRVAEATASIEVNLPAQNFAELLDPRRWHVNIPTVWPAPTEVLLVEPIDRSDNGTADVQNLPVESNRAFYEEAISGWDVLPVTRHRNLLRVTLDFSNTKNFEFSYRQESCLTVAFMGTSPQAGGIDVDNGFGSCQDLLPGSGTETWCRLEACKRLRFDIPSQPELNQLYNDIDAVALPLLIESFVLFGALRDSDA